MRKAVMLLTMAAAAGLPALAQTSAGEAPDVGAEFQAAIDEAWREAADGTSSFEACAAFKGSLHGRIRSQGDTELTTRAARAIQACEVDVPVRYFQTYLDAVAAGEYSCSDFLSHVETQMGGIGTRPTSLEGMEPEEPRPLVLKALADRIKAECPFVGAFMLRGLE
jgi:hypothetical protein